MTGAGDGRGGAAGDAGGEIGPRSYLVLFGFLALAAAGGTAVFLVREAAGVSSRTTEQLQAIADLKVHQIEAWLWERRGDMAVASRGALSPGPDGAPVLTPVSAEVRRRLRAIQETYQYRDVLLYDGAGRRVLAVADGVPAVDGGDLTRLVAATLQGRALRLGPIQRHGPGAGADVFFDIAAPLFAGDGDGAAPVGAIVMRVVPLHFLNPILRSWPAPSATGETTLSSEQGGATIFITEPRHPVAPVLSVARQVTGAPWVLTAKIDRAEAFAPFRRLVVTAVALLITLLSLALLGLRQWSRRLADRVVGEGERRFREMFMHAQLGYMVTGHDGRIQLVNPAAAQMLGYDGVDDLVGRNTRDDVFVDPRDRDAMWTALRTEGRISGYEARVRRKDGREIFVEGYLRLLRGPDGKPSGTDGIIHDVTERKRYQEALEREQQALIAARESALEAARMKSEFVANMSHEIRTPVNAVVGLTHLVLQTPLADKQRDYLQRIQSSARALLDVINDVLDFSKIEAGQLALENTPFLLDDVLRHVNDLLSVRAEEKGIALRFEAEPAMPQALVGDPTRLGQVLLNLAGNGVKFTERGQVAVRVSAQAPGEDGTVVLAFTVSDSGIGMSADQVGKLFRPFTQADGSTTRQYGGTGLGLVISRRLIEQMNGDITVDSTLGQGSTFRFTVRLALASALLWTPASPARSSSLAGMRVLLVEDLEINQLVAREILEAAGAQVTVADNGQEATTVFAADGPSFALVLMDVQMPVMDGYEATRNIRRLPGGAVIPIIAMTAHAFEAERARCLAAGMNDHLAKPIDPTTLVAMVARLVARPEATGAPDQPAAAAGPAASGAIDVAAALNRIGGNKELLHRLLRGFVDDSGGAAAEIRSALLRGDVAVARQRAHALRGTAGNLSLPAVFAAARSLDEALRRDPGGDHEAALSALAVALTEVGPIVTSLASLDGQPAPATPVHPPAIPGASLAELIAELDSLLQRRSLNASGCFDRVRQVCAGTVVEGDLASLGQHIQGLDYETSRRDLRDVALKAGVSLPGPNGLSSG